MDERALRLAKTWQKAERAWTVTELAAELSTTRANLTGKRGGKPRCPLFSEFWDGVQTQRAEAKMRRQA